MFLQCFVVFVEPIVLEYMSVPFQGHARALQIAPLDIQSQRAKPSAVSPDLSPGTVSGCFSFYIFAVLMLFSLGFAFAFDQWSSASPKLSAGDGSHRLQILLIHPSTPSTVL